MVLSKTTYHKGKIKVLRHTIRFTKKFWDQYWSTDYFNLNVDAVKTRRVDLIRIFIIDPKASKSQLLSGLIQKHIDNGINVRIIDKSAYSEKYDPSDLQDMLIVDDQVSGLLILEKEGRFHKVESSIDPAIVASRSRNFERLLETSMTYDTWRKKVNTGDQ